MYPKVSPHCLYVCPLSIRAVYTSTSGAVWDQIPRGLQFPCDCGKTDRQTDRQTRNYQHRDSVLRTENYSSTSPGNNTMHRYVCFFKIVLFRTDLFARTFLGKRVVVDTGREPGRIQRSRSRRDPRTLERVAGAQNFCFGGSGSDDYAGFGTRGQILDASTKILSSLLLPHAHTAQTHTR